MAKQEVRLPDLKEASGDDEAGDAAKISFVYVDAGDAVDEGDDLVEMVTDKATFNVPAPAAGTVESIHVSEDDEVKTGDLLMVLETP
ncbi:MAG: lipoyl domain-containing protein [Planctomycetota bacterium]